MRCSSLVHSIAALLLAAGLTSGATVARAETCGILGSIVAEPDAKTQEVSTQDVRQILADRTAILVDTRTRAEYAAGHIPGSHNLAQDAGGQVNAVNMLTAGDKTKALVLYCNGPYCQASRRLSEQLLAAGFTNVRRYQLGIPVWRALGGPTELSLDGLTRIHGHDRTAVFIDARSPEDFAQGSLPGARNLPVTQFMAGAIKQLPLPEDDFNTRVVLFGRDASQARALAQALSNRPWHNVSYVAASFDEVRLAIR